MINSNQIQIKSHDSKSVLLSLRPGIGLEDTIWTLEVLALASDGQVSMALKKRANAKTFLRLEKSPEHIHINDGDFCSFAICTVITLRANNLYITIICLS